MIVFFQLSIRGALNSIYDPLCNSGTIISFFLGNYLNWVDQVKAQLVVPIIFMIAMCLLPESPEYLTNRNKEKVNKLQGRHTKKLYSTTLRYHLFTK